MLNYNIIIYLIPKITVSRVPYLPIDDINILINIKMYLNSNRPTYTKQRKIQQTTQLATYSQTGHQFTID